MEEELNRYRAYWQRHLDIMVRQESDLFEAVGDFDLDPRSLEVYASDFIEDAPFQLSEAEFQLTKQAHEAAAQLDDDALPESDNELGEPQWTEEVVEVDTERLLNTYLALAVTDETVLKYAPLPDVDPSLYPASFTAVQPLGVLKALYHGR